MTNNTDVTVKAQNTGPGLCFLVLLVVWAGVFFIPEAVFLVVPGMIGFSLLFLFTIWHLKDTLPVF
jgi:Na+/alanine symporter